MKFVCVMKRRTEAERISCEENEEELQMFPVQDKYTAHARSNGRTFAENEI
jgi:hypothetical protein